MLLQTKGSTMAETMTVLLGSKCLFRVKCPANNGTNTVTNSKELLSSTLGFNNQIPKVSAFNLYPPFILCLNSEWGVSQEKSRTIPGFHYIDPWCTFAPSLMGKVKRAISNHRICWPAFHHHLCLSVWAAGRKSHCPWQDRSCALVGTTKTCMLNEMYIKECWVVQIDIQGFGEWRSIKVLEQRQVHQGEITRVQAWLTGREAQRTRVSLTLIPSRRHDIKSGRCHEARKGRKEWVRNVKRQSYKKINYGQ